MAVNETRLAGPTQPGTSGAAIYTVPASTRAVISSVVVCNASASAAWIKLGVGGVTAALSFTWEDQIPAGDTIILAPGIVLEAAEELHAAAEAATSVTVIVSGYERDV